MPVLEGCKHSVEIEVPIDEVQQETDRVIADIQKRAKLPGFRPGKAPVSIIKTRFSDAIRQEVLEHLVPRAFRKQTDKDNLRIVGSPSVTEVHFHANEPLRFKAEFEVAPEIELKEYRNLEVEYEDPEVSDQDLNDRIEDLRERKADYVNQDPRPIEDGDYAVVHLKSIGGLDGEPIENEDMMLHIGDSETFPEFTENLRGVTPGETKEFDVKYPDDYGQDRVKGKTIRFRADVKAIRKKEKPELDDAFAQDLGDFKNVEELRDAVKKSMLGERTFEEQKRAKDSLVDQLIGSHEFPVPEAYVERQIEAHVESRLRALAAQGIDPRNLKLDWDKIKESTRDRALHDVKASLLLEQVADREAIHATQDEVDREIQRIAKGDREPVAAVRMKLEKDGTIGKIANHIRTEKTLNFLFENSRKVPKRAKEEPTE